MFTRNDYMENRCTHRQYYGQFVNEGTKQLVLTRIGKARLLESKDEHMNDIPLGMWDRLVPRAPGSGKFKEAGDYYTLSGGVCMLKEAARQIIENEVATHATKRS